MKGRLVSLAVAALVVAGLAAPAFADTSPPLTLSLGSLKLAGGGVAGLVSVTVQCPASATLQTDQRVTQPQLPHSQMYAGFTTYTCTGQRQRLTLVADLCGVDPCPRLQPGRNTVVEVAVSYQTSPDTFTSAHTLQVRRATAVASVDGSSAHVTLPPAGRIILNGLTVRTSVTISCPKSFRLDVFARLLQARPHGLSQVVSTGITPGASPACTGAAHRYALAFQLDGGTPWQPGTAFLDVSEYVTKAGKQQASEFAYRTVALSPGGAS